MSDTTESTAGGTAPPRADGSGQEALGTVFDAIVWRQHISPRRLVAPGPDAAQVEMLFAAAAAAPDHGTILPWRFIIVPQPKRAQLADAFHLALSDRDPNAAPEEIAKAREKAFRSPFLALALVRLAREPRPEIPDVERIVSLGAALQNILLCATAMGFGSGLTSGKAMTSPRIRTLFKLNDDEHAVCFVNVGTVTKRKPVRLRPSVSQVVTTL